MKAEQIKPIGENILVFFDQTEMVDKIGRFYIDTTWLPTENVKDSATMIACGAKVPIPEGSTVWLDYLVHSQDNNPPIIKDEKGLYFKAEKNDVYLWEKGGQTETIGTWIIVDPILVAKNTTTPSGLIIPNEEKKGDEIYGIVKFLNDQVRKDLGIEVGDEVMLDPKLHYAFKYKGKEYYRIHTVISLFAVKRS